jgi:flagellar biosynthesis protein FlhG
MIDQATELRKLVLRAMRDEQSKHGPAPRLILLTSGHSGVGVTTLGVNLSVALAEQGLRVILVDANSSGGGVGRLCGLPDRSANADLLESRRDIHEVLQLGPAGIQIVPGLRMGTRETEFTTLSMERLMRQFAHLGPYADCVVLDIGNGPNELLRRMAQAADDVVMVTTAESAAITDAYSRIKLTLSGTNSGTLWLVVNQVESMEQAADVHRRLRQSCERFLGHGIESLGGIPRDASVRAASEQAMPFVRVCPESHATRSVQRIATELVKIDRPAEQSPTAA